MPAESVPPPLEELPPLVQAGRPRRLPLRAWGVPVLALLVLGLGLGWLRAVLTAPAVKDPGPAPGVQRVNASGTLRPVDVRLVTASTDGRIDRIRIQPGAAVAADTVILDLSNGELREGAQVALFQYQAAAGDLAINRTHTQETILDKRSALAILKAASTNARMETESLETLAKQGLVAKLSLMQSRERTEDLSSRYKIEQERLKLLETGVNGQMVIFQAKVDGAKALWDLKQEQVAALTVRAGMNGVLESVSVQVGD